MNHLLPFILILLTALAAGGCEKRGSVPSGPKVEVKVMSDGSLFLDGQPATVAVADIRFGELAKAKGVVWYYRESPGSEPPAIAKEVFGLIMRHKLPISFSGKPDFTDYIDDKGESQPREQ